jgi:hypothetical protein
MGSDRTRRLATAALAVLVAVVAGATAPGAEPDEADKPEKTTGWFNSTDLSIVVTDGNSRTQTYGFKNTLRAEWKHSSFRLKLDGLRSDTADDRFLQVDAGYEWEPGATPPADLTSSVVDPPVEPDLNKYFVEARYDRKIREKFMWHAGASWDRNDDAGIVNRWIGFGGVGHDWVDRDELMFRTNYGLSLTDREEDTPDPLKEDTFAGLRASWDFRALLGKVTTFEQDLTGNMSLEDTADFMVDMTNSLSVAMSEHVALKVSLQWQFSHEPALEDVDIVARVIVIDPDGDPGNGDELFRTVDEGGAEIEFDEGQARKKELDTTFRTSLVINF